MARRNNWRLSPLILVAALAACGGQERSSPGRAGSPRLPDSADRPTGDWLVYGDTAEPSNLNCARAVERPARQICRLVSDSLIDFDQSYNFIPRLAESFEVSPDGLTILFRLARGVRWHDGSPLTARDVLHTVEVARQIDPTGENFNTSFGTLSEVTAPDDLTVKAVYSSPYVGALRGWRDSFIVPAHIRLDPTGASPLDRAPIGTGPFRFRSWTPQSQIVLEANEEYFGGRPGVDRFVYRILPNGEALRAAVESGAVAVAGLSPAWLKENSPPDPALPFRVMVYPTSHMEMIYWNMKQPRGLFTDPRVRQAMTMLLDREGYITKIHAGVYRQVATLIDPQLWGGDPDLLPHPFDPGQAARLLDGALIVDRDGDGVRDAGGGPMSFTLLYTTARPEHRGIAEMLERSAAAVGVRVLLQGLEWAVFRAQVFDNDFDAAIFRWRLEPLPDPFAYFHSSQIGGSGFNLGAYSSPEYDRLSEEARHTLDPRRSAEILERLQKLLHDDQPCTFIAAAGAVLAVHKRFRTPETTASGWYDWYPSILSWWVPAEEQKYH